MKNTRVIQIRAKMALSAPRRVPNTIACVNRDGLETTANWMKMNVMEVGIRYFSKIHFHELQKSSNCTQALSFEI